MNKMQGFILDEINIDYYCQANYRDGVIVFTSEQMDDLTFRHSIVRNKDNEELVRAETHWSKINNQEDIEELYTKKAESV